MLPIAIVPDKVQNEDGSDQYDLLRLENQILVGKKLKYGPDLRFCGGSNPNRDSILSLMASFPAHRQNDF